MKQLLTTLVLSCLSIGMVAQPATAEAGTTAIDIAAVMAPVALEGQVNLNTASTAELELLPGIGPSTAAKIIEYRAKHPFKEAIHLMRVKGVGRKTYDKIKPHITVEGASTLRVVK